MKVLHVIAVSGIGGAERLLIDLVQEQCRQGANVSCIFFYRPSSKDICHELTDSLKSVVQELHLFNYNNILEKQVFIHLQHVVSKNSPDIIHSHLKHADIWLAILKWRKKINQPVVSTLHGYRDAYQNKHGLRWNAKSKYSFYYWITKFTYSRLDACIAVSKGVAGLFVNAGICNADKIKVIYNGIDIQGNHYPLKEFNCRLVLTGRIVYLKGHRYAIDAVSLLKKKYPSVTLHIIGKGPDEAHLRQIVSEKGMENSVFFHGFKPDILTELMKYDIALVPSIGEAFGLVFLEAFQAGLPVVAFDVAASNEIVTHEKDGLLATPFEAESLARNIEKYFTDDVLRTTVVKNAKETLHDKFTLTKMATQYLQFYNEFLSNNRTFSH